MNARPALFAAFLRAWSRRIFPTWIFVASVMFLVQIAVGSIVQENTTVKTVLKLLDLFPAIQTTLGGEMFRAGTLPSLILIGYYHPLSVVATRRLFEAGHLVLLL